MSRRRIALGVGASMLDRIVVAVIQLALVPIMATHWGLERFGNWAMLMTIPSLLALGDLGFAGAAIVRMTMETARGEFAAARQTVRSATQILMIACTVMLCAGAIGAMLVPVGVLPAGSDQSALDLRIAIILLVGYTGVVLFGALVQGAFRSTGRFALGSTLQTLTLVAENALLIAAILAGCGLLGAVSALCLGRLLGLGIQIAVAARLRTGLLPGLRGGSAAIRRELIKPALATMLIPLATALLLQGTVAGLGMVAGAAAVPAFVAARTLSRIGLQGAQMLTAALMPEFGSASAQGNRNRVQRLFVLLAATAAAIAVPFALVLALAGPWIVRVWSNQMITAGHAMMAVIALSALCGALWKPLSDLMLAQQRQTAFAPAYAVLAGAAVLFTMAAAPALGSMAAALALALVDLAMLVLVGRFAWVNWIDRGSLHRTLRDLAAEGRSAFNRIAQRGRD